jgi:putative DNA methylase
LFAQLVDDPSSRPDLFPQEQDQRHERERLHRMLEALVRKGAERDKTLLAEAAQEIARSARGSVPPAIVDPFSGSGCIALEAQRLGLCACASDLNPVAVLINKALLEIPPKFAGCPPVFPGLADSRVEGWERATGLAADVQAYGEWMRAEAQRRIGAQYPQAILDDGNKATVIAWIWARTVTCPNPACGIEMPLVRSWWLSKKKGREAWIRPLIVVDPEHASGKRVDFEIGHGQGGAPTGEEDGTVGRSGARCIACGSAVGLTNLRAEGRAGRLGERLMAIVAEGNRRRAYVPPTPEHVSAAMVELTSEPPEGDLPSNPRNFNTPAYGLTRWADLFTDRQLLAVTTFCDLVADVRDRAVDDALAAGASRGERLEAGGTDAEAYADAVATYTGLIVSKCCDFWSSICSWNVPNEQLRTVFSRQALPMTWDFVEVMPFSGSTGGFSGHLASVVRAIEAVPARDQTAVAQSNAVNVVQPGLISTDPPYYDNINYSDLSDFFYVWLRRSLRNIYPDLFSTVLVPKADELVANPYRHGGKDGAREFFERGFQRVFTQARENALDDYPITVYYAFKQSEANDDGTASTGWETLLDGMIRSGWAITATWPTRSERTGRMLSVRTNALASAIVLALRPRPDDAPTTDRRGLITALQDELPSALRKLQQGAIAPVDLPQAAIGPGMAVFSRYAKVIEDDGTAMSVRSALARINEILDEVLSEQEGDFDSTTRFAIAWYRQYGYVTGEFGAADELARARNTAVETLVRDGILTSAAGKVTLHPPAAMPEDYDVLADARVGAWEVLHHLIAILERDGVPAAGGFLASAKERPDGSIDTELVKELAFLLFSIAEKNGWTQDALAFNTVATAWPDVVQATRVSGTGAGEQVALALEED